MQVRVEYKDGRIVKHEMPSAFVSDGFTYHSDEFIPRKDGFFMKRKFMDTNGFEGTWGEWTCVAESDEPYVAYIIVDGETRFENTREEWGEGELVPYGSQREQR